MDKICAAKNINLFSYKTVQLNDQLQKYFFFQNQNATRPNLRVLALNNFRTQLHNFATSLQKDKSLLTILMLQLNSSNW